MSVQSTVAQLWAKADRTAIRTFFISIAALTVALILAIYSGAAADLGNLALATGTALGALVVAAWVGVTLVPVLAKRTPLRWIGYKMDYKVTREGWIYISGLTLVALAALNTGNNLLFLILSSLIAIILMSGILSSVTLSGVAMRLELPEHIFAGQTVRATVELHNEKLTLPSFSLRVEGAAKKGAPAALLGTPVYFPYLAKQERERQSVPMTLPRRGVYRQDAFRIVTRFPFGFLQKARQVSLAKEACVYPSVEATQEFLEIMPGLQGAMETLSKGPGHDLYGLREYVPSDSSRYVHWKASARSGALMIREFTREDDCRLLLILDPYAAAPRLSADGAPKIDANERFERAVTLCAGIAWHFYERNAFLQFRSAGMGTSLLPAEEVIFPILRYLSTAHPLAARADQTQLATLAAEQEVFKIIVTSRPHGSIPTSIWHSSYIIFIDDLGK